MAEERNVGLARATDNTSLADATRTIGDDEPTKEELQRRMEEARESITQTVSEIKDTVATQYQTVRESINDALDWREQYRRRPIAFSVGALGVGLMVGYSVRGMLGGGHDDDEETASSYEYDYDEDGNTYEYSVSKPMARSYAAGAITGGGTPSQDRAVRSSLPMSPPMMAAAASDSAVADYGEPEAGPGLLERFRGTQAYDRLTGELSTLGSRFVDELSHTAQTVVLPTILSKLKDAIGIDLSTQKRQAERSRIEREASDAHAEAVASGAEQQAAHEQARS